MCFIKLKFLISAQKNWGGILFLVVAVYGEYFLFLSLCLISSYKPLKCIALGKKESPVTGDVRLERLRLQESTLEVLSGPEIERMHQGQGAVGSRPARTLRQTESSSEQRRQ